MLTAYYRSPKHMIKIACKNGGTLPNLEFKKYTLYYIIHGWCGSPDTFSHNRQTSFKLAQAPPGIFSVPLD
jgi:hypothetical protein